MLKNITFIITLPLYLLLFVSHAVASSVEEQSYPTFKISNMEWPIIFEDNIFSNELLLFAMKDINLVYGHFDGYDILRPSPRQTFQINATTIKPQSLLNLKASAGRYRPRAHKRNIEHFVEIEGETKLVIPSKLLAAYKQAFMFKQNHVSAFERLNSFINYLNSLNQTSLSKLSDTEKRKLLIYTSHKGVVTRLDDITWEKNASGFDFLLQMKSRLPSILSCFDIKDIYPTADQNVLVCETLFFDKKTRKANKFGIGYWKEKWSLWVSESE